MSAFKKLFTNLINAGGDQSKLPKDMRQMLKVFVKESAPHFLVSDSYFYVPAYFTQSALNEFKEKFSNVSISDLQAKVILITSWSLELKRSDTFTSYSGLEVRLIVNSFKPQLQEELHPVRWPTNLYRDDEFKTTIQAFRHAQVQSQIARQSDSLAPLTGGKGDVSQGIVASKGDEWSFKEGTTKVASLGGAAGRRAASASAAKVKGGASGKRATKAAAKGKKSAGKSAGKSVKKVMAFTPSKKTPAKGKRSTTRATKGSLPTPAGKKSKATTDQMTMATFKQFLKYHDNKKSAAVLGKRSSAKSPAKGGKRSAK